MPKMKDILKRHIDKIKSDSNDLLKNKTFYLFVILTALIVPALFFEPFVYVVCLMAVVLSVFFTVEQSFGLIFYLYSFFGIFSTEKINLLFVVIALITIVLTIKTLIDMIKTKSKPNWWFVLFVATYLLFLILPIHQGTNGQVSSFCNLEYFGSVCVFFAMCYIIFYNREKINFLNIFKIFICGFLIAGLFGLFYFCSDRLQSIIADTIYHGIEGSSRYCGLFIMPNTLADIASVALGLILYFIYSKKIGLFGYISFAGVFVLGYLTLARAFLYIAIIEFVIFAIITIIRDKKQSYKTILPLAIETILIMLICFHATSIHVQRLGFGDLVNGYNLSVEDLNKVNDPGRAGLIKKYLLDYVSAPIAILFGRGIAHDWLGGYSSHNTYLQAFWNTGLVGVLILIIACLLYLKMNTNLGFNNYIKTAFSNAGNYLLILPVLALMFIENLFMNLQMIITIILVIVALNETFLKNSSNSNKKINSEENLEENKKI